MGILDVVPGHTHAPGIARVRHEPRLRTPSVATIEEITPDMRPIAFRGEDLADLRSAGSGDHVEFPIAGSDQRRDHASRRFDATAGTLTLDFALHEAGPASGWARGARPGDAVRIAGPQGSSMASPACGAGC